VDSQRNIPISYSYMREYLTDATFTIQSKMTFANFKLFLLWFLDTARLNFSLSVSLPPLHTPLSSHLSVSPSSTT
jgi:hypothetical protein